MGGFLPLPRELRRFCRSATTSGASGSGRARARQLYKAFCTKKVAGTDIQTVALERMVQESHDELAFIAVVGERGSRQLDGGKR